MQYCIKIIHNLKQNALAFWISVLYVALGGVVACSLYPGDPLNDGWWPWAWIITFPVNIFSVAYRGGISTQYYPVIIIQSVVFVPAFIVISEFISNRKKKRAVRGKSIND